MREVPNFEGEQLIILSKRQSFWKDALLDDLQ